MFDLEKAIAAWRHTLQQNSAFLPDDIDELEGHVRDQVQGLVRRGIPVEDAFDTAMAAMGGYGAVEDEYRKVYWGKRRRRHELSIGLTERMAMLTSYFKIALRSLARHKGYAFINVAGLALGLALCILIALFALDELAYDRFHANADRTYRIVQEELEGPGLVWSGPQMGLRLKQDFPQIDAMMRLIDGGSGYGTRALISYQEGGGSVKRFDEEGFIYADPGFFGFFTFPLLTGDADAVLARPGTVVVTESTARRYFGDADPVGKELLLSGRFPLEVTGVAADPPEQSHIRFSFVSSFRTFYANQGIPGEIDSFWWPPTHTYVMLHPDADAAEFDAALPEFSRRHRDADDASRMTPRLQSLTDIRLGPSYNGQQQAGGSMAVLYLFSAIALFILVLACVNFVNLATARASKRAKEVSVRKVVGAHRTQLVVQYLAESVLLSLVALGTALLLAALLLPFFNGVAGKSLLLPFDRGLFWLALASLTLATGLAAGIYPALFLSGFRPAAVMKTADGFGLRGAGLRKALVVFQFAVSMALLVGTTVVYRQLGYVQQARLGFDKEHLVVLPGGGLSGSQGEAPPLYEPLKAELRRQSPVLEVTTSSHRPGTGAGMGMVWEAEGLAPDPNRQIPVQFVGEHFFEMLDLPMVAGRPLRGDDPADIGTSRLRTDQDFQTSILEGRAFVINESAARRLGVAPEEAIGKTMRFYISENDRIFQDYRGTVVGVVRDYHAASLHEPIGPVAYMPGRTAGQGYLSQLHVLVKLSPGSPQEALQALEQAWTAVIPERPFEATFLDETLAGQYRTETRMGKLIGAFAILAVLIACLGLFGLASFTVEQRTKEIGIRKVLGATVSGLIVLLSREFLKLVGIAFVIAAPLAYFAMRRWLEAFAYHIEIGPGLILLIGALALAVALLTVSYQAIRAALSDPVKSLRYE